MREYQQDGERQGAQLFSPPYSLSVDTTTIADGYHTLSAMVRDQAGNSATAGAIPITVSNSAVARPSACATPGAGIFTGCYYSGQNFDTFAFTRTDPAIHFDWTGTGPQGPVALGPDNYSVRWQGSFQLQGGTYQFTADTDDGGRLYVDGQLIYGNWTQHRAMPVPTSVTLGAGVHLIQFEYFQAQDTGMEGAAGIAIGIHKMRVAKGSRLTLGCSGANEG